MNGSRILLVEDDEDIGGELIQTLTSHGYHARLACGGMDALSAAAAEPPELVLLDLGLPDMSTSGPPTRASQCARIARQFRQRRSP